MTVQKSCITPGCRRSLKVNDFGMRLLHDESQKAGRRAGVLCPACVTRAFEAEDGYDINVPLGEVVAESLKPQPSWYVAFAPQVASVP